MRRLAIFVLLMAFAAGAKAQFDAATVLGTVTDPSGAVVARCQVELRNTATGTTQSAVTDGQGQYRFIGVPVGSYHLDLKATGFENAQATFELQVGARQRVDVKLRVASVSATVTTTSFSIPRPTTKTRETRRWTGRRAITCASSSAIPRAG
jgi:Carboxypeptidase regulatory-like domain